MVLSFSTKRLLHSRSPRKISLGHIWGCAILSVPCQKALGWRRLASKAMSPANSPTGLLSSAIFFNHYTTVFLISAIPACFFIPFQAESGNAEPGSWRPEASAHFCRCLLSSNASGKHNPRRAVWYVATLFAAPLSGVSTCDSLTWLSVVSTNSWLAGGVYS